MLNKRRTDMFASSRVWMWTTAVGMICTCSMLLGFQDTAHSSALWEPLDPDVVHGGVSCNIDIMPRQYLCNEQGNSCATFTCTGPGACPFSTATIKNYSGWNDACASQETGVYSCLSVGIHCRVNQTCSACASDGQGGWKCGVATATEEGPQTHHYAAGATCP